MHNAHSVSLRQKYDECEGAAKLVNLERPEEFYCVVADFLEVQGHPSEG